MSNDRWVRIIDPNHILRINIDEQWQPSYGIYGWKSVINIAGTPVGQYPKFAFRCRLKDVPAGTRIVDPGDNYELVNPWEIKPSGVYRFWSSASNKWKTRLYPLDTLSPSVIYRREAKKVVNVNPQPGEWWFDERGSRVFIHGINIKGRFIFETCSGYVATRDEWNNWHHEPNCTGWDWQPPQLEAQPEPLTLEQRLEEAERKIKELGRLFQQWEPKH